MGAHHKWDNSVSVLHMGCIKVVATWPFFMGRGTLWLKTPIKMKSTVKKLCLDSFVLEHITSHIRQTYFLTHFLYRFQISQNNDGHFIRRLKTYTMPLSTKSFFHIGIQFGMQHLDNRNFYWNISATETLTQSKTITTNRKTALKFTLNLSNPDEKSQT